MTYLGAQQYCTDAESVLDENAAGKTVFHTVAWKENCTNGEKLDATYLHMYMQLQRNLPTYPKLRSALRDGLTEAEIRQKYPSMASDLVDTLLLGVRTANALDVFVDEFACAFSHEHISDESSCAARTTPAKPKATGTLTEQVSQSFLHRPCTCQEAGVLQP